MTMNHATGQIPFVGTSRDHVATHTSITRRNFCLGLAGSLGLTALPLAAAAPTARSTSALPDDLEQSALKSMVPGLVSLVDRPEKTTVHTWGVQDLSAEKPMQRDTLFAIASISKPVTAATALILVEQGVLELDAPIDRWLPELADMRVIRDLQADLSDTVPLQRPITLRDLLTMQVGIGAVFADPSTSPLLQKMAELELAPGPAAFQHPAEEYLRRLQELPLVHQPGEGWLYHNGLDLAGILIARASDRSLAEFQNEHLFKPLGMVDTAYYAPSQKHHRLASRYWMDPESGALQRWQADDNDFRAPPAFESGGGGLVSTVDDIRAFGRMLLADGQHNDEPVLSPDSVRQMRTDQISAAQKAAWPFYPGFWDTHGWGLGMAVVTEPDDISPRPGRFGWWGGYGTTFFADPNTDTVALLFTQRMMSAADDTALSDRFLQQAFA